MPFIPTPDTDGDLWTGDRIDLTNPPSHCGYGMTVHPEPPFGHVLNCVNDDYEIHVNDQAILTEPPYHTES